MKLLRLPDVSNRVRLGKSTIYAFIKCGKFPAPIKQGNGNYWLDTEIDAYIRSLVENRANQSVGE
ncbi:helix-turn-helix transcriptional regulator [Variovorax ginsengisoli]|uniref:helix-turn-helix transcriptional regulator n=1 Tax=Variovorax ginsengisoli TaxID=363844 RepID=UPI0027D773C0|nr:AlpA family phage regulatory protein [Variovorax ginsengisoli]